MILSDSAVLREIDAGRIVVRPFDRARLGSNSYDVTLAPTLAEYGGPPGLVLDAREDQGRLLRYFQVGQAGHVLRPGTLYLAATAEYTESHAHVPLLEGKSSLARLGVQVHLTAGVGDVGFCGHWTLEVVCTLPVRVYAGMPVAQLLWHSVEGEVLELYGRKRSAKYANDRPAPVPSAMWRNFVKGGAGGQGGGP